MNNSEETILNRVKESFGDIHGYRSNELRTTMLSGKDLNYEIDIRLKKAIKETKELYEKEIKICKSNYDALVDISKQQEKEIEKLKEQLNIQEKTDEITEVSETLTAVKNPESSPDSDLQNKQKVGELK